MGLEGIYSPYKNKGLCLFISTVVLCQLCFFQKLRKNLAAGRQLAIQHAKLTREKQNLEKILSEKNEANPESIEANKRLTQELTTLKNLLKLRDMEIQILRQSKS